MDIPEKIRAASQRLKDGYRVNRITVRDFLSHFGAERRGAVKVEAIQQILDSLGIKTEPDFRTAWIDEPIWLRLKDGSHVAHGSVTEEDAPREAHPDGDPQEITLESTPSAVEEAVQQVESAPTSAEPDLPDGDAGAESSDPTFRIGSLPAANQKLVVVDQSAPLSKAITLMLQYDFTQLPVMQSEREVKGVVTWKSIASRRAFGCKCELVGDCREDARIVDASRTLFDAIPSIVEYGYVLVRQIDRKITGIVTASDLSLQFHALAEPFLLLREIELHVRRLLRNRLTAEDLDLPGPAAAPTHKPQNLADLTFGDYIRLLQHPAVWTKLDLRIDRRTLTDSLEEVRRIRNDVMHFDPDPMTADELGTLKRTVRLMQEMYTLSPYASAP